MRIVLFLFASFFSVALLGQTAVDSAAAVKRVDSLIQVSRALTGQRDFDKALEINAAAEKIALEKLGRESEAYGSCAHNHGRVCYSMGKNGESEKWYIEAIFIREKILGKEHKDYASSLHNLGLVYMNMSNYEKAEMLQLEALAIREKVLGKEHPDFATSLNNLATLYLRMGNYEKAEPLYLEAKAIREKVLGKEHPNYSASLNNLGLLYRNMGNYEKAESLQLEALAIREKVLGKEDPSYAASLNNLANLYVDMGNYEKAEPLHLEAKAIRGKVLGIEHADYAQSLNSLANLYSDLGNYEKAEALYFEAIAIQGKTIGREHPDYAGLLNGFASLYLRMGNYEKAEPLYLEAIAIWEKVQGTEQPRYVICIGNLAILYFKMGNYGKSESLFLEANAIGNKIQGMGAFADARLLHSFASLYMDMGNYEKAEPLFLEAKAISESVLGKEHLFYAQSLTNLASLYHTMGNYEKAEPLCLELSLANQSLLEKAVRHLSERELGSYLNEFSEAQAQALSLAQLSGSKKVMAACFDNALFYKGFLLQAAGQLKRLALAPDNVGTATENFNRLKSYERRLAAQYAQPIANRDRAAVADLEAKANDLEKDLTRSVAGYREAIRQVKWQEVQQKLDVGEAAIEFVHYQFSRQKRTDSTMYAALILLPGAEQPIFVPLFEEKQLEALLKTSGARRSDYVNSLYSNAKTGQKTLFELVWQPLEKELRGAKTVYFSPSGLLHRIHLAAIPTSETANLGDRFRFVELGSTRQLVVPSSAAASAGSGEALLWGGIQYDMDSTAIGAANEKLKNELARTRGDLGFEKTDSTSRLACQSTDGSRGGSWEYLPWTEKEIKAIAPILTAAGVKPTIQKGFAATEEAFKTIGSNGSGVKKPSPRILHIATHGYFFPDTKTADGGRKAADGSEPVFKMSDHPMIRSGLLLAGSNQAWKTGKPLRPDLEDGVLTAYEISQMDLSNTELVVLSACETGLGDIQGNEGVYGLQRAFKIAGAKYLIMSLWQVPDFQTQELMTVFYQKWLTAKMPLPEAFRAAQQAMREKYEHPYFWAGFVLVE